MAEEKDTREAGKITREQVAELKEEQIRLQRLAMEAARNLFEQRKSKVQTPSLPNVVQLVSHPRKSVKISRRPLPSGEV